MSYYNDLWGKLFKHPGSYEFKDGLIFQACRAIEESDINHLYKPFITFNPNYPEDGVTEYSAEVVTKLAREYGVAEYVEAAIAKKKK